VHQLKNRPKTQLGRFSPWYHLICCRYFTAPTTLKIIKF